MTKEEMNKYAYELMVKNNPEEAVKQLLLKDKENETLKECYCNRTDCSGRIKDSKKYESLQQRINKAIEYINGNCFTVKERKYIDLDKDDVVELLKILKGEE